VSKLPREAVEQGLEFLGLIILENRLKQPTTPVIMELREANIRVLMITGLQANANHEIRVIENI